MRPDGDFVVGAIALVLIIATIGGLLTYASIESDKREVEVMRLCQQDGKQVQYRETGRAIYSECR